MEKKNRHCKNNCMRYQISLIGIVLIFILVFGLMGGQKKINKTVSIFSWYYELMDVLQFEKYSKILEELKITRVYQIMSADLLRDPKLYSMIENLQKLGIETVLLTGDKSWVEDGLAEYEQIIDAVEIYNENVKEEFRIKSIALDVEVHALPGFWDNPEIMFLKYIDVMKKAKEYAALHELKVIQVIPVSFDEIDKELFEKFVLECCDELSVMNYDRRYAKEAISYEVDFCRQHKIPMETIFETMPTSREHQVTEFLTYYYDGLEMLQGDFRQLREIYGKELGMAYHHFSTVIDLK